MITIVRERERERIFFQRSGSYFLFTYVPSGNRICIRSHEILCVLMIPREKGGELYEGNSLIHSFEIYVNPWKEEREREIKKRKKFREG